MSIIYSYPEQGVLNADDMLIGTSAEKVSGKQKNITRNFSIQQIADFINGGTGFIDPVATDFQIPVFNQSGTKITGSIMSQNIYPNGTGITISGSLATTGSISTPGNLTATGIITLGSNQNLISLNSQTRLNGPILDTTGTVGSLNQILLSDSTGVVRWQNYVAGLTYQGVWNANTNTPALTSGVGTNGHFYVVDVLGNTNLNGNNDWQVGDWALFSGVTGAGGFWDKIDNTQSLTGSGTANTITMWTAGQVVGDSLISQAGTVVSVDGDLKVKDTIQATTANTNLKLKGVGTGGIEIMSADGVTDGKITLNCSQNSHGVTLQSPPHASGATYTLILPTSFGGAGDVLTSQGTNPSQLVWTTPTTGTVTNFTTVSTAIPGITTAVTNPTTTPTLTLSITGTPTAALFLDGTGNWSSPGGGVTDIAATAPLDASAATGSVTLSMPAYATATGGYVPSGGATNQYLDGLSGSWTTLPVSGVTSVTSANNNTLTVTSTTTTPVITAVTTGGVSSASTSLATGAQIQLAIDNALAGTLTFKGTFNATTGAISSPGSGQLYTGSTGGIAVTKGDFYIADTSGSFYGTTAMNVGDEAIALNTVAAGSSSVSDWSVVPAQSAGGTVTGTGAATQVTFWDGTSNVNGDTAFNWDNTNKRLGIGTTTPGAKLNLHVNSGTASGQYNSPGALLLSNQSGAGGVGGTILFGADLDSGSVPENVQASISSLNTASNSTGSYGDINFNTKNILTSTVLLPRMTIKADGNVGIGITTPSAPLHVFKSSHPNTMLARFENPAGEALVEIKAQNDALSILQFADSEDGNVGAIQYSHVDNSMRFKASDLERMRIASTGQVRFNNYTSATSFTGTAVASLAVDSSGNIITETPGGGGGASTITTDNFSGNATVGPFTLGTTPSGGSTSFVDVFIDGVYQEIATYTVSGTALSFVVGSEPPTGTNIQTKTTSGTVSGALVSSVDIGQSSGDVGAVNLRINPIEVPSGTTPTGVANSLYIFTSTTGSISTLTLPASPTSGDSIKISNIGGLANVIATSGTDKIMGAAGPMTINVTNAAFELIWSNIAAQGWIIIGNV